MNNMAANDMRMEKEWTAAGKGCQTGTNQRSRTVAFLIVAVVILAAVTVAGILTEDAVETDFSQRNLSPGLQHLFGTDWMGRDMLARTLSGLSLSIRIGILTAVVSAAVALLLGTASVVLGRKADAVISWCIDLVMGIPHILLVMLISLACGRGFVGVVAGVALSHWPSLARVIRGELMQLRQAPYILVAEKMGVSKLQNVKRHMLPHPFGEYAVPDHRKVVACPFPRTGPCSGSRIICPSRREGKTSARSVKRARIRRQYGTDIKDRAFIRLF